MSDPEDHNQNSTQNSKVKVRKVKSDDETGRRYESQNEPGSDEDNYGDESFMGALLSTNDPCEVRDKKIQKRLELEAAEKRARRIERWTRRQARARARMEARMEANEPENGANILNDFKRQQQERKNRDLKFVSTRKPGPSIMSNSRANIENAIGSNLAESQQTRRAKSTRHVHFAPNTIQQSKGGGKYFNYGRLTKKSFSRRKEIGERPPIQELEPMKANEKPVRYSYVSGHNIAILPYIGSSKRLLPVHVTKLSSKNSQSHLKNLADGQKSPKITGTSPLPSPQVSTTHTAKLKISSSEGDRTLAKVIQTVSETTHPKPKVKIQCDGKKPMVKSADIAAKCLKEMKSQKKNAPATLSHSAKKMLGIRPNSPLVKLAVQSFPPAQFLQGVELNPDGRIMIRPSGHILNPNVNKWFDHLNPLVPIPPSPVRSGLELSPAKPKHSKKIVKKSNNDRPVTATGLTNDQRPSTPSRSSDINSKTIEPTTKTKKVLKTKTKKVPKTKTQI